VINAAILAFVAVAAVVNGFDTEALPLWRQLLFPVLAAAAYLHGRRLAARYDAHLLLTTAALTALTAVVDTGQAFTALMVLGVFAMLPWFVGRYRRQQMELLRAGEERVARLERERELVAERAQAQERARIAADLHDSVGHDLALIALRAGALELAPTLAEPDREAASALRASAVEATDRLRHALGMLREGTAPVTPFDEPVEALVERSVGAGMAVRLEVEAAPLRPLVDRAVYRVVQEALTNAAKHAEGAVVTVRIEQVGEVVRVAVVSAGQEKLVQEAAPHNAGRARAGTAKRTGSAEGGTGPEERTDPVLKPVSVRTGPASGRGLSSVPEAGTAGHRADGWESSLHGSAPIGSGLAGLAERVRLLGGVFAAGPRGDGFAVEAELPVRGDV
jgi:signal transduction histidine kinase